MRLCTTLQHKLRALGQLLRRLEPDAHLHFDRRAGCLKVDSLLDASQLEVLARGLGLELAGQLPMIELHRCGLPRRSAS